MDKQWINRGWHVPWWAPQVVLVVKNLPASAGDIKDMGLIPGLGRSPGGGHNNPLQYSCLENPMDWGAWQATVHRVTKTQLSALSFFIMLRNNNSYLSVIYHFRLNVHSHFPGGPSLKNLPASARDIRDVGSIPGLGKSPGEGNGNPFQYSCLENPMDREDWWVNPDGHRVRHDWSDLACMYARLF